MHAAVLLLAYSGYRDVQAAALFSSCFHLSILLTVIPEELPTQTAMVKNICKR